MFFSENKKFKKNSSRLLSICGDLIDKYQSSPNCPPCKADLLNLINKRIIAAKNEVTEWKDCDTNYIEIAHSLLAHVTFDLLASGNYHLYRGYLNPMSCADNLMDVYKATMQYGLDNDMFDEETRKEQYSYLLQCISEVG